MGSAVFVLLSPTTSKGKRNYSGSEGTQLSSENAISSLSETEGRGLGSMPCLTEANISLASGLLSFALKAFLLGPGKEMVLGEGN